jgi:hypothetical protein
MLIQNLRGAGAGDPRIARKSGFSKWPPPATPVILTLCQKHLYLCAIHLFVASETTECDADVYFALLTKTKIHKNVMFDVIFIMAAMCSTSYCIFGSKSLIFSCNTTKIGSDIV